MSGNHLIQLLRRKQKTTECTTESLLQRSGKKREKRQHSKSGIDGQAWRCIKILAFIFFRPCAALVHNSKLHIKC